MGNTSTWTNSGSYWANHKLSQSMRMQAEPMYVWRQFVDSKEDFGKGKGDAIDFTKQLLIDSRGGTLVETNTFPTNKIKYVKDSLTVTEYGNGTEVTEKATTLSQFDLRSSQNKGLVEDQKNAIDYAVSVQFQSAKFKAVCVNTATVSFTTNGTATATATANPSDKTIRTIIQYAKKKRIPKLGSYYNIILSTDAMGGVYDYLQAVAQYAEPSFRYTDEIGKYYGARFIEENNYLSNVLGAGSVYGEGVLFGEEAVQQGVALAEELRYWEDDGGRIKKYVWYAILGFKKTWDLANDDSNSTGVGIERIIHITSA